MALSPSKLATADPLRRTIVRQKILTASGREKFVPPEATCVSQERTSASLCARTQYGLKDSEQQTQEPLRDFGRDTPRLIAITSTNTPISWSTARLHQSLGANAHIETTTQLGMNYRN